jgi:hypothetical protein
MKRIPLVSLLFFNSLFLFSQVINNPNDQIYKDIDRWAVQGYITQALPQIRPYPAQLLDTLLQDVIDRGNPAAQQKAASYLAAIAPGSRAVHVGLHGTLVGKDTDITLFGAPTVDGVLRIENWITGAYELQVYGSLRKPGEELIVPGTYSPYSDFVLDWANVGPINILQDWNSTLALGSDRLYFQSGLNRTSFGPFYDSSIVVGSQAGRAGHFSLEYRRDWWNFGILFMAITGTDDFGQGQFPDKYLMLHTLDFKPRSNLEFGFFESVVWGGRFEPLYFIPLDQLFAAQSMAGFSDNSLFGIHARWLAKPGLQVLSQLYVDDLNFNDLARFHFNTKYKLAGQAGINYLPIDSFLPDLRVEYTAVMPYMYTHETGDENTRYKEGSPNYFNYTHRGQNLGTDLEPNSDRIKVSLAKALLPELTLTLSGYFTRHGNASEDYVINGEMAQKKPDGTYAHDGSVLDDGRTDSDSATYHYETRFLTQTVIDYRLTGGLSLAWSFPTSFGVFGAQADYVLEYGWNRNLKKDDNGLTNFWGLSASWRW